MSDTIRFMVDFLWRWAVLSAAALMAALLIASALMWIIR